MIYNTDDVRIGRLRALLSPAILLEELPMSEHAAAVVTNARTQATDIIKGNDDRLMVVVGPCSIHDTAAARDYARRLKKLADEHKDDLQIIMRVYFEKPRTTVGWKGLINDPDINNSFNINKGLREARALLRDLAEMELPAGTEFLDTITPQYFADLVTWGAIGARTTESQIHRELASGLSCPVGFKNGTGGSIKIAVDAIGAAAHPHNFLSVTKHGTSAIVETTGNDACHLILRGSTRGPNYDAESVADAVRQLEDADVISNVMVDCSHGNSKKDHNRQPDVAKEVADQLAAGQSHIMGVMIESHLVEGNQKYVAGEDVYGQSITDACINIDTTASVLQVLAEGVRKRREKKG